jgi:hypothetical protein
MNDDQVEELLRQAGRPAHPPARLGRSILAIPGGPPIRPSRRRFLIAGIATAAAAIVVVVGATLRSQPAGFQAVSTVQFHGSVGTAEARLGNPNGPNRPVQLVVQHLNPGEQRYFELWSLGEQPPMMLTTFMTNTDGSCVITFSAPATVDWKDIVITPRGQATNHLLCNSSANCG